MDIYTFPKHGYKLEYGTNYLYMFISLTRTHSRSNSNIKINETEYGQHHKQTKYKQYEYNKQNC